MSAPTPEVNDVSGFAAIINSRLNAESRIAKAVAFGWSCAGAAIFLCLTGAGIASSFLGYSYMLSVRPAAEKTARALVAALERAQLKTSVSGTMALAPNSELKLAAGQTVKLEDGAIIALDPKSTVRVVALDTPQPSKQQLQIETTSRSEELPFTNYTIFQHVSFKGGSVVTGWDYELSEPARPKVQFCYYSQPVERGSAIRYTIAWNGAPDRPAALPKNFDFNGALSNCTWF